MSITFKRLFNFILYMIISLILSTIFLGGGDGTSFPLTLFYSWGIFILNIVPDGQFYFVFSLVSYQIIFFIITEIISLFKIQILYFILLGLHLIGSILSLIISHFNRFDEIIVIIVNLLSFVIFITYFYHDYKLFHKYINENIV